MGFDGLAMLCRNVRAAYKTGRHERYLRKERDEAKYRLDIPELEAKEFEREKMRYCAEQINQIRQPSNLIELLAYRCGAARLF